MKTLLILILFLTLLAAAPTSKIDAKTGLVWQGNRAMPLELDYAHAVAYCRDLSLDGFSDWRLPEIEELATIIDLRAWRPALKRGFQIRPEERFWSITTNASDPKEAWVVSFGYGEIEPYPKNRRYHVRCVRGEMRPAKR